MKHIEQLFLAISSIEPGNREGVITLIIIVSAILIFSLGLAIGRFILP